MAVCEHCGQEHASDSPFCPNTGKLIPSQLLPEGTLLEGKYRIGRALGVGGMGAVFEARHTLLDKRVAIKVMLPEGSPDAGKQFMARMVREARAASATGHRNIAQVTDMGWVREGSLFVVMEYLDGQTLRDLLEKSAHLDVPRAVGLMRQVLSGLDVVHRSGIVHRDLKPDNLMVVRDDEDEEVVKILDFGISKVLRSENEKNLALTSTGLVMGTPQYMAPEQARNSAEIDHRTDIYSAGAILYRMVTGTLPHQQESLNALIGALLSAPIEPPSRRREGLPRQLDDILLRALARDPARRFDSARAFREALQPFEAGAEPPAPARSAPPPAAFGEVDESSLVTLDESAEPAAPAAPERPAAAPEPEPEVVPLDQATGSKAVDPFAPPDAEDELALELDDGPAAPTPRAPAQTDDADPDDAAAAPARGDSVDRLRTTGPYGQARRSGPRTGLWVGLVLVAAGAFLLWRFVLREDSADVAAATPDGGTYVEIHIDVSPRWAEVTVDGVSLTSNPLILQRSHREHIVAARAKGYFPQTAGFTPDQDRSLLMELKPRRRPVMEAGAGGSGKPGR